jgi:putative transposase
LIFFYLDEKQINLLNNDILGIDLGLMSLYTDSNGNKTNRFSKKLISKYYNRISNLNKSLSNKNKNSLKFKKVKEQLGKTYDRLKNTKNDYLHKESLKLVNCKESIIALGDIKIKSIIENKNSKKSLVKSFYLNSLGIFKQYVVYKSVKYNKRCLLIDERMTSKTCSCCGNIKYNLKLSDRINDCLVCKNSIDRDENSAINMKLLGSSSLSLDKLVSLKGNNKLYTFEYNL